MKKQPWRYNPATRGSNSPDVEKDIEIAKLKEHLDYLKTFVMTDYGVFTFPDGEFIYGCGIKKTGDSSPQEKELIRLQTELTTQKLELAKVSQRYQSQIENLQADNDALQKRRR